MTRAWMQWELPLGEPAAKERSLSMDSLEAARGVHRHALGEAFIDGVFDFAKPQASQKAAISTLPENFAKGKETSEKNAFRGKGLPVPKKRHCWNCLTVTSPQWRREIPTLVPKPPSVALQDPLDPQEKLMILCNACGLHFRVHSKHRTFETRQGGALLDSLESFAEACGKVNDPGHGLLMELAESSNLRKLHDVAQTLLRAVNRAQQLQSERQ